MHRLYRLIALFLRSRKVSSLRLPFGIFALKDEDPQNGLGEFGSLWQVLALPLLFITVLCPTSMHGQQVEPSLPVSQRLAINLSAGVPQYLGDATTTSNEPQSHWWFQNTNNSPTYSTPGLVEGNDTSAAWTQVGLPYDANIPRTFINQDSGGGQGSLTGQENWYRLHFKVASKYAGRKFLLNIEGSHTALQIYINGTLLKGVSAVAADSQATHVVGFIPVAVDLTPYIHTDGVTDNVIAIDVSRGASWFEQPGFSGAFRFGQAMAGLFRNVYLYVTNPVHIPLNVYSNQKTWGTYVGTVSEVPAAEGTATASSAVVEVQTNVLNETATAQQVTLTTQIVDASGNVVVTAAPITQSVAPMTPDTFPSGPTPMFDEKITVPNPTLWYPNNSIYGKPYMYRVYHIVSVNGVVVDSVQSPLGIRTITWDANFPYFNGHAMYLWGGSSRYDYPALGSSVPDEQWWRDMEQIADQGGNIWRPGHSTSSEEMVEAADAYGIMIVQPSGDGEGYWNASSNPTADDLQLKQELHRDMIIRDRSHPSILAWEEDNGGMNSSLASQLATLETQWDNINPRVQGDRTYSPAYAYMGECDGAGCEAGVKQQNPNNPSFGAEYWDNMGTGRGLAWDYQLAFAAPYLDDWRKGKEANAFGMAQWYFAESPGEDSLWAEYQNQPFMQHMVRSLGYSSVDANRFPRLLYYIYQANWIPYSIKPVVHLAHHWNRSYEYTPGTPIQENAFSNCPSVRLLVNGVAKDPVTGAPLEDQTPNPWNVASNTDLTQNTTVMPGQVHWMVNWVSGTVTAECLDINGNVVPGVTNSRTTAGTENKIVLSVVPEVIKPDGTSFQWTANGSDAAFIKAEVQDANGNLVPTASDNVTFSVSGPATYMGGTQQLVADPSWTNYYEDAFSKAHSTVIGGLPYAFFHSPGDPELNFEGGLQKIALRSTFTPGAVTVTATAAGLASASVTLTSVAPPAPSQSQPPAIIVPPVDTATTAGYPATFTVTASGSGTLSYQWYQNGSAVGTNSSTYTTPATTLADDGHTISVTVSSDFGQVNSTPVTLTVESPANVAITTQPASQTAAVGQSVTLTVAATGSPALKYDWYENGQLVQSGTQPSYTTPVFTGTETDNFYVLVSNPVSQLQSGTVTVTVIAPTPVSITTQLVGKMVSLNQPVQLTAVVTGSAPFKYQWQFTPAGSANTTILTSSTQLSNTISYSIPNVTSTNVGAYTVTVNNAANVPVTSAAAQITLAPPGANLALNKTATSSSSQNACNDGSTTPPFSGAGCLGAENAVDGNPATRWGSATAGAPPTPPVAGVDPSWLQVDLGSPQSFNTVIINWENAYAAQYQIQYTSADPATNPTWQVATTNNSGKGGTETLTFPTVQARYIRMYGTQRATQYGYSIYEFQVYNVPQCGGATERYTISSSNSSLVTDNQTGLTWTRTTKTDSAPGSQFTGVDAQAYCASINMRLPTKAEALGISGDNDATCAFPGVWTSWTSTVDPNNANNSAMVSFDGTSAYQVTNNYPGATLCTSGNGPVIQTQPRAATVSVGQTATFTVAATGTGTLAYQWYKNGSLINGATAASYTTPETTASDNGTSFNVAVSDANGTAWSTTAVLTVTGGASPDFTVSISAPTLSVTAGSNGTEQVTVTPANGFPSSSAVTFSCSGLPAGATCTFAPATVASNGNIVSTLTITTTAASAALRGNSAPLFMGSLLAGILCFFGRKSGRNLKLLVFLAAMLSGLMFYAGCGGSSVGAPSSGGGKNTQPTTATVTVTAVSGSLQHTAAFSLTVNPANSASASLGSHHSPGPSLPVPALAMAVGIFDRKKHRGRQRLLTIFLTSTLGLTLLSGCSTSSVAPVTGGGTNSKPTITTQPASQTVTAGQTATFSIVATGAAPLNYQWQSNNQPISGATSASYTTPATTLQNSGTNFSVVVSNSVGSVTSNVAVLTVTSNGSCSTVPSVPGSVTASATSSSQISLSWSTSTAGSSCAVSYTVFRSTSSGFVPSANNQVATGITATSFADTGLTASTTYYYVVEAVDSAGASAASSQASASTSGASTDQVEIVAINSAGPQVDNTLGGDATFAADEFYSGGGTSATNNSVSTLNVTNAAPAAVYQTERNGVFTYTIPGLAPGAQYTVLLHFAETYFTAAGKRVFNVAINGTPVLSNFDIYAKAGGNTALVEPFSATANSSGQIVVAYTRGTADQPKSSGIEIRGFPSPCTVAPAAAPTGLTAIASSPSIIGLSWNGVAPPPNCAVTYNLYASKSSGFTPSASNLIASGIATTAYSNTGLTPSTTYYYVVEAVDVAGASAPSAQASAETHPANSCISIPVSPGSLTATAASSSVIGLSWAAITPPANCTNVTYNLYASKTSGFTPTLSNQIASGITGTVFFHSNLAASTTYYYVVEAADEDGAATEPSGQTSAATQAPPTGLTATAVSANEVDLVWPVSGAAAPVTYLVFRSTTQTFTPSAANQIGTTKSNAFQDVLASPSTTYYYIVKATNPSGASASIGPAGATTLVLGSDPPFWDASNIPATPAGDVMMFKILNRTNGRYPDSQVYWNTTINGVTTTHSVAEQATFAIPTVNSGRMQFYLGPQGTSSPYSDFIEFTIGSTFFNGNTTRVDAFGIKLAFRLTCSDGTDIAVGENASTFAEDRAATFQQYVDSVPSQFKQLAQTPYKIVNPGGGGFDTGGAYADYYSSYISDVWTTNGLTITMAGPNGDGLKDHPDLSAAIYRHTAGPGTFNPDGTLISQAMWGNPSSFYQQSPADYYAQFLHTKAINGQQYAFPYDDAGGYSSDVSCTGPKTLIIAVGW